MNMNAYEQVWEQRLQRMTIRMHPRVTHGRGEYEVIEVYQNWQVVQTVNWVDRRVGMWDMRFALDRGFYHRHVFFIVKDNEIIRLDPFKTWAQNGVVAGTVVHRIRPSAWGGCAAEAA